MSYTARIKVTTNRKDLFPRITYQFVNETQKTKGSIQALDSNWCTAVYDCAKDDVVYFALSIKGNGLHKNVYVKPQLSGKYNNSIYYLYSPIENKPAHQQYNKKGSPIFVLKNPYANIPKTSNTEDKSQNKKQVPSVQQNSKNNPIIAANEQIQRAEPYIGHATDAIGVLSYGAKMYALDNFYWGILHDKRSPAVSWDRMKKITDLKNYKYNPETGGVFRGNGSRGVSNVGKVVDKVDKKVGVLSLGLDGVEAYELIKKDDAPALAVKAGEVAGTAAMTGLTVKVVGECSASGGGRRPEIVAGKAITCAATMYMAGKVGKEVGAMAGESGIGVEVALAVIKADEILHEAQVYIVENLYNVDKDHPDHPDFGKPANLDPKFIRKK